MRIALLFTREFPQQCLRNDREALYRGMGLPFDQGLQLEYELGMKTLGSGESTAGAERFTRGTGKHGKF